MIDRHSAEHYLWGQNCDGWHLLRSPELSIIQERMPPGASELRHTHSRSRQFFFVLSGQAAIEVDGVIERLGADQGIEIPPQTPHQVMNRSQETLEFVVVSCPPSHGDKIEA